MAKRPVQGRPLDGEPELTDLGSTLQDTTDSLIGAPGTPQRNEYEDLLQRKIVSAKLREYRKLHDLTQEELGERLGVLKNQIAKLERDSSNIRLGTLFKVFRALGVGVKLQFEAPPTLPPKLAKLAVFALLFFLLMQTQAPLPQLGLFAFSIG